MLINATDPEEIRVATLVDSVLSDYDIEFVHNEKIKGNIYKAKVVRADTSLQAAFIHYGGQKNGFLPIGELPRDMVSADGRRGRIQDLLSRDQEIMVQAVREELGTKGAMMTAQISLPGRYLVLTPGQPPQRHQPQDREPRGARVLQAPHRRTGHSQEHGRHRADRLPGRHQGGLPAGPGLPAGHLQGGPGPLQASPWPGPGLAGGRCRHPHPPGLFQLRYGGGPHR